MDLTEIKRLSGPAITAYPYLDEIPTSFLPNSVEGKVVDDGNARIFFIKRN